MQPLQQDELKKDSNRKRKPKVAFTEKEDQALLALVQQYGNKDWTSIAKYMDSRTPRQCRERYNLYLRPDVKNTPWTEEEDDLLIRLVAQYGSK